MSTEFLLHSKTSDKWRRTGVKKRAGIAVPLFSVYSQASIGIGEIPDLNLLVDWCPKTGMSIIQLLPLNDVGGDFAPYSAVSTFALDPMYLRISSLKNADASLFEKELARMKNKYRPILKRVNYRIKQAKLDLLWEIYKSTRTDDITEFASFKNDNSYWLNDYALYKVISELNPGIIWGKWPDELKSRDTKALEEIAINNYERIQFHYWLQWQLFEQIKAARIYAAEKGVLLMGDLPFLVSRESADVWSHPEYFHLNLSSGAPPDMYFASGQKWGMPPYNWNNIANHGFDYLKAKLKYAENFYDMYRIDHFVGLFRVWVSPAEDNTAAGSYLPPEEYMWEAHGRRIISEMTAATTMLPCAEDLGTVPGCSFHVLAEYGIPGIDFQRYYKNNFSFRPPGDYRVNSCAVLSTHDSSFWINWWQFEAGTIDEKLFEMMSEKAGIHYGHCKYVKGILFNRKLSRYGRLFWNDDIDSIEKLVDILQIPRENANDLIYAYLESYKEKEKFLDYLHYTGTESELIHDLMKKCLETVNRSESVFSIQLIQDYLCLDTGLLEKIGKWGYRINTPGLVSRNNWSILLPVSLERLNELPINEEVRGIVNDSLRI